MTSILIPRENERALVKLSAKHSKRKKEEKRKKGHRMVVSV